MLDFAVADVAVAVAGFQLMALKGRHGLSRSRSHCQAEPTKAA